MHLFFSKYIMGVDNIMKYKLENEINWTCDNEQCEEYEVDVSYPAEVSAPKCESCGRSLTTSAED